MSRSAGTTTSGRWSVRHHEVSNRRQSGTGIGWRFSWPRQPGGIILSTTAHLGPCPPEMGVVSHMPKRQRPPKHAQIKVKLDTVMGVAREMGRLIRLSYNGHLPPEELTKYIFALDKLRACLESAVAIDAAAAAQVKNEPTALTVNIIAVPEGYSQQPDGRFRADAAPALGAYARARTRAAITPRSAVVR